MAESPSEPMLSVLLPTARGGDVTSRNREERGEASRECTTSQEVDARFVLGIRVTHGKSLRATGHRVRSLFLPVRMVVYEILANARGRAT